MWSLIVWIYTIKTLSIYNTGQNNIGSSKLIYGIFYLSTGTPKNSNNIIRGD